MELPIIYFLAAFFVGAVVGMIVELVVEQEYISRLTNQNECLRARLEETEQSIEKENAKVSEIREELKKDYFSGF
jgi:uncharacterized membrane-anchored protein YhcB (DUF1043 family)